MMDVAQLRRLQHAVRAAADIEADSGNGAETVASQYNALRQEIEGALPDAVVDEFGRLFPEVEVKIPRGRISAEQHFAKADLATGTAARLKTLVGWLEGVIQTADEES
jgi:hypothetical protein